MLPERSSHNPQSDLNLVWSQACVEILESRIYDRDRNYEVDFYQVRIEGGEVLFSANSHHAACHFVDMLLEPLGISLCAA